MKLNRPSLRGLVVSNLALGLICCWLLAEAVAAPNNAPTADKPSDSESKAPSGKSAEQKNAESTPRYTTEHIRGRVVWLAEAVRKLHGVETDPDFAESLVALQTKNGRLVPLLKDARGRGFMMDDRLRNRDMELLVRRYEGLPLVQVITVFTLHDGEKFELDYWCDICTISMYELKECECCQGPIRLRERR